MGFYVGGGEKLMMLASILVEYGSTRLGANVSLKLYLYIDCVNSL